jgi:RNA-directed DNA polymerase
LKRLPHDVGRQGAVHNLGNLAAALAFKLLSGPWTRRSLETRAISAFGSRSRKRARRLIEELLTATPTPYAPRWAQLVQLIESTEAMKGISPGAAEQIMALSVAVRPPTFHPIAPLQHVGVPPLTTEDDLAHWLQIPLSHLDWLTDERRTLRREKRPVLQHYEHIWRPKSDGTYRLIEAPKPRLRDLQRRILREILDRIAPHYAAYGFVKNRSCAIAAAKHAGEDVVVTVDLKNFFLNTSLARVHAIFRCLGYPYPVARAFTLLCSTATPLTVLDAQHVDFLTRQRFATPHLPQGAPTSPALANLASLRLDRRLTGLAHCFEARYTRYADDLTFSGDRVFHCQIPSFLRAVSEIVQDEGFTLNTPKTRIMPRSTRQTVTGIVVNDHINVPRRAYDALKATLTNCLKHGPASQNRHHHPDFRNHLDGRIVWISSLNPQRGEKLRRLFEAITWPPIA